MEQGPGAARSRVRVHGMCLSIQGNILLVHSMPENQQFSQLRAPCVEAANGEQCPEPKSYSQFSSNKTPCSCGIKIFSLISLIHGRLQHPVMQTSRIKNVAMLSARHATAAPMATSQADPAVIILIIRLILLVVFILRGRVLEILPRIVGSRAA